MCRLEYICVVLNDYLFIIGLINVFTSSLGTFNWPSGRNWNVLMVKRRVWACGGGGRGSKITACSDAGSNGFGHLESDIESDASGKRQKKLWTHLVWLLLWYFPAECLENTPFVKDEPHSLSRSGVGHTEVHQQYQVWIRSVEETEFQVEGFPKQHLHRLVVLGVVALVLGICKEETTMESNSGGNSDMHN